MPALQAACAGKPACDSSLPIYLLRVFSAYSSFNLNVEQINKSMAVIKMTMDYAAVRRCLYNVVYFTLILLFNNVKDIRDGSVNDDDAGIAQAGR
ncbi:hypothetical protein KIV45_08705 [Janthinobacterium lividum]|nr:hypothetical protein KIV45_08705 [Janthinobacterium lividum]